MKKSKWFLWAITALLLIGCESAKQEPEFELIAWQGPDLANTNPSRYQEIVKAGFTAAAIPLNDVANNKKALKLAEKEHLKLLISDPRIRVDSIGVITTLALLDSIHADYATYPALLGYNISLQTPATDFTALSKIVQVWHQKQINQIPFINLYPSYTGIADLEANSYPQYLKKYFDGVKPKLVSFNHFPIIKSGIRTDYYENLELIQKYALKQHISFWGFVLTWAHGVYQPPGESHLRLQAYSNLAYGAHGLVYYTYCTPPWSGTGTFAAILDTNMRKTRLFRHVQIINGEIRNLAPILRLLRPVGVYHTEPIPNGCHSLDFDLPIVKIEGNNILVGIFVSQTQIPYFLIVNRNFNYGAKPYVYFDDRVNGITEISKNRMESMSVNFEPSDGERGAGILLKAGDGRLFRIQY